MTERTATDMSRLKADLLLLLAAAVWGLAFVFQKTAMSHVGPLLFIAARCGLAALALAPMAWREQQPANAVRDTGGLVRLAVAGGVMFLIAAAFQQFGIITATVTNSGFLTGLYVVITPLLVWLWYRTPPGPTVWMAVALAFVGTWLLGGGTIGGFSTGDLLVAICAFFWAVHILVTGSAAVHGRPMLFNCLQFAVCGVLALAGALATETVTLTGVIAAWPAIAYVGLLSSALTFTLLTIAMRYTPASEAAILIAMESLFAALAGAALLGDRLTPVGWVGAALMFAATLIVQWSAARKGQASPRTDGIA